MPRLAERSPLVGADRLLADLVAPPRFAKETFGSYRPDPAEPSQAEAVVGLREFLNESVARDARRTGWRRRRTEAPARPGIYLDGGFGVGKTHLLAALWHEAPEPKAFGTFVEFTHLVGALGFGRTVRELSAYRLVCIDEFELDDPGDTVLMSTLLSHLVKADVRLAASSNTLPDRLGEGRFAADDFLREIQDLSAHFTVLRIDGPDFRHRDAPTAPRSLSQEAVRAAAGRGGWLDDFGQLMAHLTVVHPSGYGALLDGVDRLHLTDVTVLPDQAAALRLVVLADRLYDRDVAIIASGTTFDQVFTAEMLRGGYRKKYHRAISRLLSLSRAGADSLG